MSEYKSLVLTYQDPETLIWKKVILEGDPYIKLTEVSRNDVIDANGVIYIDKDEEVPYVKISGKWYKVGNISNLVEDTSPQLGGDLDLNGHKIAGVSQVELIEAVDKRHDQNTDTGTTASEFYIDTNNDNVPVKAHIQDTNNPHHVTVAQLGGVSNPMQEDLNANKYKINNVQKVILKKKLLGGWDLRNYNSNTLHTLSTTYLASGYFSPDGTLLYLVDIYDKVHEYKFNVPWDISTDSELGSISSGYDNTLGIFISNDGLYMYLTDRYAQKIGMYALSTSWDITTATKIKEISVSFRPYQLAFKSDGTKMIVGGENNNIYSYVLSTPWDLETASQEFYINNGSSVYNMFISPDGTKLYATDGGNGNIKQYILSTPWDISSANLDYTALHINGNSCLIFSNDGSYLYISSSSGVYQHEVSSSALGGSIILDNNLETTSEEGQLEYSNDKVYITDSSGRKELAKKDEVLSSVEQDPSPKLGGELNAQNHTIGFIEQVITSSSGSAAIDWTKGNKAAITLTEDVTLSFTNPSYACNLQLKIVQDSNGGHSLTFPAIKWAGGSAPTLTSTANAIDIVSLYFDGTNYYGMASLNFS